MNNFDRNKFGGAMKSNYDYVCVCLSVCLYAYVSSALAHEWMNEGKYIEWPQQILYERKKRQINQYIQQC